MTPPGSDPADRPERLVSLLGGSEDETEETAAGARQFRGDTLVSSEHSRHADLDQPLDDLDPRRAEKVCAEVTRLLLADFAPSLMLLAARDRTRAQALISFSRTLFDFTNDRALEGEQLAHINRWHYTLDVSLELEPVGQPVFVRMATEHKKAPWQRELIDKLVSMARSRIGAPTPSTEQIDRRWRSLGGLLLTLLVGDAVSAEVERIAALLMRAHSLLGPSADLRWRRPDLDLADTSELEGAARIRSECEHIVAELATAPAALKELPRGIRRALRFACLGANELATQTLHGSLPAGGARLALGARVKYLLRARF